MGVNGSDIARRAADMWVNKSNLLKIIFNKLFRKNKIVYFLVF